MIIQIHNRAPKLPEISKSIIEKINVSKNDIAPIADKIITAKEFSYKASDGDIIRKKIIDGISVVEIEISDNNISDLELLCETNISIPNTPTTRRIIKIEGNMCDVAVITLGYYRKYENDFLALNAKGQRQTFEQNNKIVYQSLIKCSPENKELVLNLIKSLKIPIIEQF